MKTNRNIILIIITLILIVGIFFLGEYLKNKKEKEDKLKLEEGKQYVEISVKNYGKITVELDANVAPITVTNFMKLVNKKFYDGLTFHRIMAGFMIQGGTYDESGDRKNADTIKGEFSLNGVENNLKHERGVISMARSGYDMDGASSGFFIMQEDNAYLDGGYAAFGKVLDGMEVVDKIVNAAKPTDDNGSIPLEERPVIEYIKEINVATTNEK